MKQDIFSHPRKKQSGFYRLYHASTVPFVTLDAGSYPHWKLHSLQVKILQVFLESSATQKLVTVIQKKKIIELNYKTKCSHEKMLCTFEKWKYNAISSEIQSFQYLGSAITKNQDVCCLKKGKAARENSS